VSSFEEDKGKRKEKKKKSLKNGCKKKKKKRAVRITLYMALFHFHSAVLFV
jgi:hypothetical protein